MRVSKKGIVPRTQYNRSLTDSQALQVFTLAANGTCQREIARKFNISDATVSNIVTRKLYRAATETV